MADLIGIAPAVLPVLGRAGKDPNPSVRAGALEVLMEMPPEQGEILLQFVSSLKDPDRTVRYMAARGLDKLGAGAEKAVADLIQALKDPEEEVRSSATSALLKIGSPAVPALTEAAQSQDYLLSSRANFLLERIREQSGQKKTNP